MILYQVVFVNIPLLKRHKFCIVAISSLMQPSWNIQCVGESFLKQLVLKFLSKQSRHFAKEMLIVV
jgi:hypothetical protein